MPALSSLPARRSPVKMWRALGFEPYRLLTSYAGHGTGSRVFVRPSRIVYDEYTLWFEGGARLLPHWIPAHAFTTFFAPDTDFVADLVAFEFSAACEVEPLMPDCAARL